MPSQLTDEALAKILEESGVSASAESIDTLRKMIVGVMKQSMLKQVG